MNRYYVRYNQSANSYSVFQHGRKNEFGEPWCEVPLVTQYEAEQCMKSLNDGKDAWAWLSNQEISAIQYQ